MINKLWNYLKWALKFLFSVSRWVYSNKTWLNFSAIAHTSFKILELCSGTKIVFELCVCVGFYLPENWVWYEVHCKTIFSLWTKWCFLYFAINSHFSGKRGFNLQVCIVLVFKVLIHWSQRTLSGSCMVGLRKLTISLSAEKKEEWNKHAYQYLQETWKWLADSATADAENKLPVHDFSLGQKPFHFRVKKKQGETLSGIFISG